MADPTTPPRVSSAPVSPDGHQSPPGLGSEPSTPTNMIDTPPYSSRAEKTPGFGQIKRSFADRRHKVPSALDIGALHRERQFSGPYSANPLLKSQLTPKEPKPTKDDEKVKLPLISELMAGAFISPSRSTAPVSLVSPMKRLSGSREWSPKRQKLDDAAKKERFLQLCSEAWDLLR